MLVNGLYPGKASKTRFLSLGKPCKSWKPGKQCFNVCTKSGYRFGISNPGIFVTEHVHYAVLITVSA